MGIFCLVLLPGLIWAAPAIKNKPKIEESTITADAYVLMDADSGSVYLRKNVRCGMIPASTIKILTALLVSRQGRLDRTVVIPKEAEGVEGSSMYLTAGEKMTRYDLLNGLLLCSANDAAVALAVTEQGSVRAFVLQMNRLARQMNLKGTWCVDPDGLSDENRTTVIDLAQMARMILKDPVLSRIVRTQTYRIPSRPTAKIVICNHNKLLRRYPGADGVKTGYTIEAGHTLVASAKRGERHWIAVVLRSKEPYSDVQNMMDYGFARWPGIKKEAH